MITATLHLLEILRLIFDSNRKVVTIDEKSWFRNWIKKWICDKKYVYNVFCDDNYNPNCEINDHQIERPQREHKKFVAKYSQCYFTYNDMFITDLLNYIMMVYHHLFNKNCKQLNECIDLLTKLKQDMFYESQNVKGMIDLNPNAQHYRDKFEKYGRAFMKYYHLRKIPFIIYTFSKDPNYQLYNENNSNETLKLNFRNLITLITSNSDKEWLEFLHGPILNIRYALHHHEVFCSKHQYEKNGIWSCDIVTLMEDFYKYLKEINKCLLNEKYLDRKSEELEIWFPYIHFEEKEEKEKWDENSSTHYNYYNNSESKSTYSYDDIFAKYIIPLLVIFRTEKS